MNASAVSCTFHFTLPVFKNQKAPKAIPQHIRQRIRSENEAQALRQREITPFPPTQQTAQGQQAHDRSSLDLRKSSTLPKYLLSIFEGQSKEACFTLHGLLLESETDATLLSFLGSILAFGKGKIIAKPEQALILLEEAIAKDPKDAEALASLGALLAFGAKGVDAHPKRSLTLLQAALKINPKNARALTFLGCLHAYGHPEINENFEVAVKQLEKAITIQRQNKYLFAMQHSLFSPGNLYDLARAEGFLGAINAFFFGDALVDKETIATLFQHATLNHPQEPLYAAWQGLYDEHLGKECDQSRVRAFLTTVSDQTKENQNKLTIFKNSLRIEWSMDLIAKYQI